MEDRHQRKILQDKRQKSPADKKKVRMLEKICSFIHNPLSRSHSTATNTVSDRIQRGLGLGQKEKELRKS